MHSASVRLFSRRKALLTAGALSILLAACGGGGGGDSTSTPDTHANTGGNTATNNGSTATDKNLFTLTGVQWQVARPAAGESVCFDFDAPAETAQTACDNGTAWDIKLSTDAAGRVTRLFTNSGASNANGKGGAYLGPFDHTWADLQKFTDALHDPAMGGQELPSRVYAADKMSNAFTGTNAIGSAVFEYGITGSDHNLHPNFRTMFVKVGDAVYALQVTGYYGGATGRTSGLPKFRWLNLSSGGTVQSKQLDASKGTAYFNLATGQPVADASGDWHIAFNRYNVQFKDGVQSAAGSVIDGLYDANGKVMVSAFTDAGLDVKALAQLTSAQAPTEGWMNDTLSSTLTPAARDYDLGWYSYDQQTHLLTAQSERGTLVRSGAGDSYARLRLKEIAYAEPGNFRSPQTWTFEMDVQPAKQ